jgi:predicted amidohydrolase YtcJ
VEQRKRIEGAGSPWLTARTVKFFADGVIENETGALLEPYCTGMHDHGMLVWSAEHLAEAIAAVDAAGFQPFIHAIGDAAVRQALDALEHAATENGPSRNRPVITHAQLVDPEDWARFARLGVMANLQPLWAQLDSLMRVLTIPRLGEERSRRQYAARTLLDAGVSLSFGSDWPCSSADPREGLAVITTRTTEEGDPAGGWVPEEILDIETALGAYTAGVAIQAFADSTDAPWGRIEVGSSADLAWLARDPRVATRTDLPAIPVRATYLAGTATYRETPAGDPAASAQEGTPHVPLG